MRRSHYEERRGERLALLSKERDVVIRQENNGKWTIEDARSLELSHIGIMNNSSLHRSNTSKLPNVMILKEKAQLEKIKEKQAKELQMKIEYEIKIEESIKQNNAKL